MRASDRHTAVRPADGFGYYAVEDNVHMHHLHATILHLLGLDREKLTFRHAGRDFRLTDASGRVVREGHRLAGIGT